MHGEPGLPYRSGPMALFLTWTTYGSWLPGDDRGWCDDRGVMREPSHRLARHAAHAMRGGHAGGRATAASDCFTTRPRSWVMDRGIPTGFRRGLLGAAPGWLRHRSNTSIVHGGARQIQGQSPQTNLKF